MGTEPSATTISTGCKINITLYITGRLDNGYHSLDSIFVPLPVPYDTLHIKQHTGQGLTVECTTVGINLENNTLTTAYARYADKTGFAPALTVHLEKKVPHGAGLGGGSANAAGLLQHLNTINPYPVSQEALVRIASTVGADVPFFLVGKTCHASGIGDVLLPVKNPCQGLWLLLLCSNISISTPWAYAEWDKREKEQKNKVRDLTEGHQTYRHHLASESWLFNSFEEVAFDAHPELKKLKEKLLRQGAVAALMSGSGATLFGLFRSKKIAEKAKKELEELGNVVYQHLL